MKLCKERKKWTPDDWKRILLSDESTFRLFHPSNPQNLGSGSSRSAQDSICQVPLESNGVGHDVVTGNQQPVRHPREDLIGHPVQRGQDTILENFCLPAINRTHISGLVQKLVMVDDRSTCIVMQDEAPAHRSVRAQQWCRDKLPHFWAKDV